MEREETSTLMTTDDLVRHVRMSRATIWRKRAAAARIFIAYDAIIDHCCEAWNKLIEQPWRIVTIGPRNGAHGALSMRVGMTAVY
jgi:hypothetical protein